MDINERNQLIKKEVISFLKDSVKSGLIKTITNFEIESIEMNTTYDENFKMYLIEESIWNKLPEFAQQKIISFFNENHNN